MYIFICSVRGWYSLLRLSIH